MKREKLYNLHKIGYFIVAFFVFKMNKILSNLFSIVRKRYFLVEDEFIFSYFIFLSPDIFYLKKTKYITRCSVKSSIISIRPPFFILPLFVFKTDKTLSDHILAVRKLVAQYFAYFENHHNKIYCANSRAFHAASCSTSRF